jgi:hypothetical protein
MSLLVFAGCFVQDRMCMSLYAVKNVGGRCTSVWETIDVLSEDVSGC